MSLISSVHWQRASLAAIVSLLISSAHPCSATTLTFDLNSEGQAPSNNSDLNATTDHYGSFIATESPGFITSDGTGATPNIGLTWLPLFTERPNVWEFHNGTAWSALNNASHPNAGAPYVNVDVDDTPSGQGFPDDPTIIFSVPEGVQVEFHGLDFAIGSGYTGDPYSWTVDVIRRSDNVVVDTQNTGLLSGGDTTYLNIDFIGDPGNDYLLRFDDGGRNHFSTAIDNLGFSQIGTAIPEPTTATLIALGLVACGLRCRTSRR